MGRYRVDFSKQARDIIAKRAGYRCSFPGCNALTVGPGKENDTAENNGKAAHIYSASKGGPRGQGFLTGAQLRDPANGIWMCPSHSDLIDKNSGKRYPIFILQSWKSLHESRISYEYTGSQQTFGFIRRLTIDQSPIFDQNTNLEIAKATVIVGGNATGKTAICQWLFAIASPHYLRRWSALRTALNYKISFAAPIDRTLTVSIPNSVPQISLDRSPVPANPVPISATYIEHCGTVQYRDDLDRFVQTLTLDAVEIQSLADFIDSQSIFLNAAKWVRERNEDNEWVTNLTCTLANGCIRDFGMLSGSEQGRVLLDFAVARAAAASKFVPSILIVEVQSLGLDWNSFLPYMAIFTSSSSTFQTLITAYELPASIEQLGWQVYRIEGRTAPRKIVASAASGYQS